MKTIPTLLPPLKRDKKIAGYSQKATTTERYKLIFISWQPRKEETFRGKEEIKKEDWEINFSKVLMMTYYKVSFNLRASFIILTYLILYFLCQSCSSISCPDEMLLILYHILKNAK